MDSELQQMCLTMYSQARQIKQLVYDSGPENGFDSHASPQINELIEATRRLSQENKELKEVLETLKLRDSRLDKVDRMQRELDKLMASTETEKRAWQMKEADLLSKLEFKEKELRQNL